MRAIHNNRPSNFHIEQGEFSTLKIALKEMNIYKFEKKISRMHGKIYLLPLLAFCRCRITTLRRITT